MKALKRKYVPEGWLRRQAMKRLGNGKPNHALDKFRADERRRGRTIVREAEVEARRGLLAVAKKGR